MRTHLPIQRQCNAIPLAISLSTSKLRQTTNSRVTILFLYHRTLAASIDAQENKVRPYKRSPARTLQRSLQWIKPPPRSDNKARP